MLARLGSTVEEAAQCAEAILTSIVPDAHCVAQEWDNRIDCFIVLDGVVIGEMIAHRDITERRIRETADRLRKRQAGEAVPLVNELRRPVGIAPSPN
jgi:hypothetical protein